MSNYDSEDDDMSRFNQSEPNIDIPPPMRMENTDWWGEMTGLELPEFSEPVSLCWESCSHCHGDDGETQSSPAAVVWPPGLTGPPHRSRRGCQSLCLERHSPSHCKSHSSCSLPCPGHQATGGNLSSVSTLTALPHSAQDKKAPGVCRHLHSHSSNSDTLVRRVGSRPC